MDRYEISELNFGKNEYICDTGILVKHLFF